MVPFLWRRGAKREPGRAKHQEPGWFVQLPIIGGLNQPPGLRPLRRLRGIFLMGAATPPCPRRGLRLSLQLFSMPVSSKISPLQGGESVSQRPHTPHYTSSLKTFFALSSKIIFFSA